MRVVLEIVLDTGLGGFTLAPTRTTERLVFGRVLLKTVRRKTPSMVSVVGAQDGRMHVDQRGRAEPSFLFLFSFFLVPSTHGLFELTVQRKSD